MIDGDEDGRAEDDAGGAEDRLLAADFSAILVLLKVAQHSTEEHRLTEADDALLEDEDEEDGQEFGEEGAGHGAGKVRLSLPL